MLQVYGPKGLGKLSTGGHPRHLAQAQQGRLESQPQNGVNNVPHMQQHQDTKPVVGSIDNHEELQSQDQVKQGTISQDQLSQVQRSQEQHSQQQVKDQFSEGGAKGKAGEGQAQAVPIRKADCFATFNPPTVQEYQEVMLVCLLHVGSYAKSMANASSTAECAGLISLAFSCMHQCSILLRQILMIWFLRLLPIPSFAI